MTFWSGNAFVLDQRSGAPAGDSVEWNDIFVTTPNTLLRTLIWVYVEKWGRWETGESGLLNLPISWALGDLNSVHHSVGSISPSPGNAEEELIATDLVGIDYTALGFPPNSTGSLTGSVNDISSSATLATDYNNNAFALGAGRSEVDSHAQRHFTEIPTYQFQLHRWAEGVAGGQRDAYTAWVMVRMLYSHP